MDDNSVEKNIIKGGIKIVEHLNLFTVLHAFWVVEMYYLGINAIFNMNVYFDQEVIKKIPNVILKYNETFLSYFKDYNEFVCLFGTAILFCGLANVFIKFIPIISKFNIIYMYVDYGLSCGFWLLIIYETYRLYLAIKIAFLFTPIFVFLLVELLKKLNDYIEEKTGFTFIGRDY